MSKMTLYLKAKGDELKLVNVKTCVYTGNINSYVCEFELSSEWDDMNVFAVFCVNDTAYNVALLKDRSCVLPNEVLEEEGEFFIGLYATNGDDENLKRISTGLICVKTEKGCCDECITPIPPLPDVWEQLVSKTIPYIGENKNWYIYDLNENEYTDTGICAVLDAKDIYTKEETDTQLNKKEDKQNKVNTISESSDDIQYPSAKAVKDFVDTTASDFQEQLELKADKQNNQGGFSAGEDTDTNMGAAIG